MVMFGNWLNGGYYALAPLIWFLIGWASRPAEEELRLQDEVREDEPRAVPPAEGLRARDALPAT